MLTNKKSRYILILVVLSIFLFSLTFITSKQNGTISPPQFFDIKNDSIKIIESSTATRPPITKNIDIESKVKNALKHIKNHNRTPSGQTASDPKILHENHLLKSTRWKIWQQTQVINVQNKSGADKILAQVGNLLIIESQNENTSLNEFNSFSPIAVYDKRLKKAGVITGTIKIETLEKEQLENDLNQLRAHITDSFDPIHTYFITSLDQVFDLELLYETLKSYPYIKNIELEVLNKNYEKN